MEPVFVAEYTATPGLFQEPCCRIRRIPMIVFGTAAAIALGQLLLGIAEVVFMLTVDWDIWYAYDSGIDMLLVLAFIILRSLLPFLLFTYIALRPLAHAKKLWARSNKYERFTASFYEDHLDVYNHCDGGTYHFNYEYIKKIVCSRNYIIIRTRSRMFRPIPKTALVKGSPAELENFLRAKKATPGAAAHPEQT